MQVSRRPAETASMHTFRVEASGFSIDVTADCSETLDHIEKYLLPYLPRSRHEISSPYNPPNVEIVLHRDSQTDRFRIEVDGSLIAASEALPYTFTLVQQAADDATIRYLRDKAVIHAGTVVYNDKAIVVSGNSGSGKSRLVQEFLRHGAEYSSDEYAILDRQGYVHPYPRTLMIRTDGDQQYPVLPSELHAEVREQPAPAALFLFLRFEPNAPGLDIQPLDRSEFLIRLLQSTPQVMADRPDVLAPLMATASLAKSYAGVRGEVSRAAAEILHLAAAGGR